MSNIGQLLNLPWIDGEMVRVEAGLRRSIEADDPYLTEIAGHLLAAGGKRLRPALAILAAVAGGSEATDDVIMGGVAVELVHVGSLYHDDVMDEATTRRGVPTVNARWGNLIAILSGDFLLARASEIAASLGTDIAELLARTIGRLCEGQVGELKTAFSADRTEAEYLASIRGKTASLTAAACRIGAITGGLSDPAVDAFTIFGDRFGMTFQIVDDILDVVASDADLGKPAGNDLVEGVYTLPVIRAVAAADGAELRPLLRGPMDEGTRDKARDLVRSSPGVAEAAAVARQFADEAGAALLALPGSDVLTSLARLPHRLIDDALSR